MSPRTGSNTQLVPEFNSQNLHKRSAEAQYYPNIQNGYSYGHGYASPYWPTHKTSGVSWFLYLEFTFISCFCATEPFEIPKFQM